VNWKEFNIEIVTPCFNAGADQSRAEIRIPSIRGQVRWWFRALGGTRDEEKTIFGGVHGDPQRSKVILRLKEPLVSDQAVNLHDLVGRDANLPQAYLLWPLRPTRDRLQKRGMIPPGRTFTLLCSTDARLQDDVLQQKLASALELWILLGSLGTRSRRGYGSITFKETGAPAKLGSQEDFRHAVAQRLSNFGRPSIKAMFICGRQESAELALDRLGAWLKAFRAGSTKSIKSPGKWGKNDHDRARDGGGKLYRPVIGLPLTQRYSDGTILETAFADAARWASPVHLKVVKCAAGFYPLAVFFPDMALQEGERVTISGKRGQKSFDLPVDHGLLREMMTPGPDAFVVC
jgi:CRISPR type III-B/RAMP module RAMP protein Cmr1